MRGEGGWGSRRERGREQGGREGGRKGGKKGGREGRSETWKRQRRSGVTSGVTSSMGVACMKVGGGGSGDLETAEGGVMSAGRHACLIHHL